jgi:hypothetical protein
VDPRTRLPVENRIHIPARGEETDVELLPAGDVTDGAVRVGWETAYPFRRLRIFADAYGWTPEERRRLPQFGTEAAELSIGRMEHAYGQTALALVQVVLALR